jgi:hypothetical protein
VRHGSFFDRDADPAKEASHHRGVGLDPSLGRKAITQSPKRDVRLLGPHGLQKVPVRHQLGGAWSARTAEYLEIAESKLIGTKQFVEGTLTRFSGFHFGTEHPFTYLEGKRVLELALGELRGRGDLVKHLGMNPKAPGRAAILGRHGQGVWDFLSLSSSSSETNFTKHPHLTLNVSFQAVEAVVTVPHGLNTVMRRNIVGLGEDGFREVAANIVKNLKPLLGDHKGAAPWFRGLQRRYPAQKAVPFVDATIEFDLRTAVPSGPGLPKTQRQWLSAAYGSFVKKESANYQIQMGVVFRYERCPELQKEGAIGLLASSWLACKPLHRFSPAYPVTIFRDNCLWLRFFMLT